MDNKKLTPLNYYSAPQASIYINGILIDECYDIQYSYRESKEPIYGYLSKFFDAIVAGTVIITGSFTINYKHDQYLSQVLKKAQHPTLVTGPNGEKEKVSGNAKVQSLKEFEKQYKSKLADYADSLKKKKDLTIENSKLASEVEARQIELDKAKAEHDNKVNNAGIDMLEKSRTKNNFLDQFDKDVKDNLEQNLEAYKWIIGLDEKNNPTTINPRSYNSLLDKAYAEDIANNEILSQLKNALQANYDKAEALQNKREWFILQLKSTDTLSPEYKNLEEQIGKVQLEINDQQRQNRLLEQNVITTEESNIAKFKENLRVANNVKAEAEEVLVSDALINGGDAETPVFSFGEEVNGGDETESFVGIIEGGDEEGDIAGDIVRLKELDQELIDAENTLAELQSENIEDPAIKVAEEKIANLRKQISDLSPDKIRSSLQTLKSNMNALTVTDLDLQSDADTRINWSRPEDIPFKFTIEFNYNGTPHKRLVHCSLLGHAHQISMSGQPVKEYYQFIAQKFEYQN